MTTHEKNLDARRKVLCPLEKKDGKTYWMRIGAAFVNKDGSLNVYLDAMPRNGKLYIRELDQDDSKSRGPRKEAPLDALPF